MDYKTITVFNWSTYTKLSVTFTLTIKHKAITTTKNTKQQKEGNT